MSFVSTPTFDMPNGNPQMLADIGHVLSSFATYEYGDEQRDNELRSSSHLSAADNNLVDFWVGDAADAFSRQAIAGRDRIRAVYRAVGEGGKVATLLAESLATAQLAIAVAQQTATARAQQAALSPIPPDPFTLWTDLYSINSSVSSQMAQAHQQAAADWNRLTRSAPNFVAKKSRPPDTKRPWWKEAIGAGHVLLDAGGLVPGFGEIADGANGVIYLAEGDKTNASLSFGAMVPVAGWGATGAKYAIKADNALDASRAAGHAIPSGIGNVSPPRVFDNPHVDPPQIGGVGGGRGDAGYGGRNPFPPGGGGPTGPTGPTGPRGPVDDAIRGAGPFPAGGWPSEPRFIIPNRRPGS